MNILVSIAYAGITFGYLFIPHSLSSLSLFSLSLSLSLSLIPISPTNPHTLPHSPPTHHFTSTQTCQKWILLWSSQCPLLAAQPVLQVWKSPLQSHCTHGQRMSASTPPRHNQECFWLNLLSATSSKVGSWLGTPLLPVSRIQRDN